MVDVVRKTERKGGSRGGKLLSGRRRTPAATATRWAGVRMRRVSETDFQHEHRTARKRNPLWFIQLHATTGYRIQAKRQWTYFCDDGGECENPNVWSQIPIYNISLRSYLFLAKHNWCRPRSLVLMRWFWSEKGGNKDQWVELLKA